MEENNIKRYNLYNFEADFLHYLSAVKKLSKNSVKNYISDFRHFAGWLDLYFKSNEIDTRFAKSSSTFFELIKPECIKDYKEYLSKNNLPRRTINRRLSSTRKLFKFAISQNWLDANPTKGISNVKPGSSKKKTDVKTTQKITVEVNMSQFKADMLKDGMKKHKVNSISHDVDEFLSIINSAL